MANADTQYGLTSGPDLHLCDTDGSEDKKLALNAAGDMILDGARIGDSRVLLLSQVASASSSLDFSSTYVTSAYDTHLWVGEGLVVASDGTDMHFLVSNDGGSTWEADANEYLYVSKQRHSGGSDSNLQSSGATAMILNANPLSNVAAEGLDFAIYMGGAARAAARTIFRGTMGYYDSSTRLVTGVWSGSHETAEVVNGMQVIPATGNITSGRVSLYGIKHA